MDTLTSGAVPDTDDHSTDGQSTKIFRSRFDGEVFRLSAGLNQSEFRDLLFHCEEKGASDIVIQTNEEVKASIGGDRHIVSSRRIRPNEIWTIVEVLYNNTGTGLLRGGTDIDGSWEIRDDQNHPHRYRYNMTPGRIPGEMGIEIVLRPLPTDIIPITDMGIEKELLDAYLPQFGLNLVTGTTSSGKSTLVAAFHDHFLKNLPNIRIIEFGDPIEYVYDKSVSPRTSVWQTEIGKHLLPAPGVIMSAHAYAIRNGMRRAPDIISITEVRDPESMQNLVKAALTGHVAVSTMHTVGVPATMRQVLQYFPHDARDGASVELMEVVNIILSQRLIPRVGGGRVAIREYMIFDEATRNMFRRYRHEEWPSLTRRMMLQSNVKSKTFSQSAFEAYERGDITATQFKEISYAEMDR